jgi:hypothetical protein
LTQDDGITPTFVTQSAEESYRHHERQNSSKLVKSGLKWSTMAGSRSKLIENCSELVNSVQ